MFHRSERLLLRPAFLEDWSAVYRGINDFEVVRMLGSAPWPYAEQDARDFVALAQDVRKPRLLVTLPGGEGTRLVGCIGIDMREDGLELGYWIARPYWGRGFATEAGKAMLQIASMLGHRDIHAGHAVDNPASGKVLRKLGFRPTGEVRLQYSAGRGGDVPVKRYSMELKQAAAPICEPQLQAA